MAEPDKPPTIKPAGKDMNGNLRALAYILSGVSVVILSASIIAMAAHVSDGSIHEREQTKRDRIRVMIHEAAGVPPRELTQRLDRLEAEMREVKAMVRDLLVAMVQKANNTKHKED